MLPRLLARSWPGLLLEVPSFSSLLKAVYNPRAFIPHAALLRQAFAHCARFPTAASRRSLGRVSVPVWLIVLSDQLPVFGLVSRYLTNYLIGRETLPERRSISSSQTCDAMGISGISPSFLGLSRSPGQVSHVLLTRSPLDLHRCCHRMDLARLACVRHAASVRPEPGSNSPSRSTTGTRRRRPIDRFPKSRSSAAAQLRTDPTGFVLLPPAGRASPGGCGSRN